MIGPDVKVTVTLVNLDEGPFYAAAAYASTTGPFTYRVNGFGLSRIYDKAVAHALAQVSERLLKAAMK